MRAHFRVLLLALILSACNSDKVEETLDLPNEITITEIQDSYAAGEYTIRELTSYYLERIEELNRKGPELNAVLSINPDALSIADSLDRELAAGQPRGPLHGIPVLLKDNINSRDSMPTTAGAIPMKDSYPGTDSPLAAQLREAGALILGKANLSEWANFHSSYSSSGWSGIGGQTRNPYDPTRNPCGSSSGSAVAVAANLCVVAIGTETNGSIVCPSNNNGIVGIKPTVGLISRTGIIPISFTQDTGGPMARTVRDAVITLGTMTAKDSTDSKTLQENRKAFSDYTSFLKTGQFNGKRIGYYTAPADRNARVKALMAKQLKLLEEEGAEIIPVEQILPASTRSHSFQVLLYEFKEGLNQYFAGLGDNAPVRSLEELITVTFSDSTEMRYFDHELLKQAQEKGGLEEETYKKALSAMLKKSRQQGIDSIMNTHDLDAIIAPTGSPAWKTDLTNGDNFGLSSSSPAAIAGYPNITVPMGFIDELPVGISIFGRAWSEPELIGLAYSYEQLTQARKQPDLQ